MSWIRPVVEIDTLNNMFRVMKKNTSARLENFNGERRITAYRGHNYMNKITRRLDTDFDLYMVRHMRDMGPDKNHPDLKNAVLFFHTYDADVYIYFDKWGDSTKGIHLEVDRRDGFEAYQRKFSSCAELRQDNHFLRMLRKFTGKDFTRPERPSISTQI